jgi:hypothetical protein
VQLASKASRRRKSQLLSGDLPQRRASTVPLPPPDHHSPPPSPSPLQDGDEPFAFPPASRSRASVRGLGLGGGLGVQAGEGEGQGEEGEVRLRNAASLSSSSSDDDYDDTHTHKTTTHKTGSPIAVPPLMLPSKSTYINIYTHSLPHLPPPYNVCGVYFAMLCSDGRWPSPCLTSSRHHPPTSRVSTHMTLPH